MSLSSSQAVQAPWSRSERHWLRTISMLGACLATTTAGTVYLFSTYGPALSHRLHLSSTQSNVVAISANYGLLLSGPFFGWAADTVGPRVLSVFAAVGSFTAFSALAYTFSGALGLPKWFILTGYMALVGLSAQAANMAAVTTTTKNFKQNRGSAVSLCLAFFGLSPFVLSHINSLFFATGEMPNTFGYLQFLSFLGLATSTIAALSLTVIGFGPSRHRLNVPAGFVVDYTSDSSSSGLLSIGQSDTNVDEERGLLIRSQMDGMPATNDASNLSYSAVAKKAIHNNGNAGDYEATTESSQPATVGPSSGAVSSAEDNAAAAPSTHGPRSNADGLDYDTARNLGGMDYMRDSEAQLLALVLFLCAGVGVFYNNNVGTIVNAMYYSSTDTPDHSAAQRLINHHVAVVSLGSFTGRLTIGIVADMCKRVWNLPRSGILVVVAFSVVVSQIIVGAAESLSTLLVGSALTGLSYGFIFGFVPTLVSVWFGTRHFGSNWGLASAFIGFSGQGLGAFFGYIYDSNIPDRDATKCQRGSCYRDAFVLSMGIAMLGLFAAVVLARRRGDRRRENRRQWEAEEVNHVEYVPFILAE
ncbi:hypothetical protein GGI25_005232 [Coemansia spiralis]|uniref:Major facilitator superfamily (MFS) profile domain-containing protein n=2 Tax=Coemansia TaxID=4863 RepID=A0A9W8KVX0_9FUNG|nr:major facilitator superfamily domain-containing protein [Coemansia spiralis]KAJ1988751.1 hypothetical protein EDC05_005102 [Coemansia umbellata]KAJ2619811.1 hypothetical protein GGI26_005527 [Coemansia sp. RSA 1358]KAJ2672159.1 hypothetical protein GGI25_005232 [Coemansia spiralis]